MENTEISGYDLANQLVKSEQPASEKFVLAVNFLAYQYQHEQINGDDDNPFSPLVSDYQRKEEDFLAAIIEIEDKVKWFISEFTDETFRIVAMQELNYMRIFIEDKSTPRTREDRITLDRINQLLELAKKIDAK